MNNTVLDMHRKPVVPFNVENADHRQYVAEYLRTFSWSHSPVLFYAPNGLSIPSYTQKELLRYYLENEFPSEELSHA